MRDSVTPRKAHSIISLSVAPWRPGCLDRCPLKRCASFCRFRRTTHCINTNTRSAIFHRQISATTRCSSCRKRGVSDKARPFSRPKPCSIRYSLRYARDALAQAHLLSGVIGRIDAPAQAPYGVGERRLRPCRPHPHALATHYGRSARTVATFGVLVDFREHGDVHRPINAMFGQDGSGG